MDQLPPTQFPDINQILRGFADEIRSILGNRFLGLYLYGSLALGDFDPQTSDIDFVVLTRENIDNKQFDALQEMHIRFDERNSAWGGKIETAYIPADAVNCPASGPAAYPQIERGTKLFLGPLEDGWAFQRQTLREHGKTVSDPPIHELIDPVSPEEMNQAAKKILSKWQEQSRHDPDWILWARQRGSQAFLVLTICRIRYSLASGSVTSKPAAARWVQSTCGARWYNLIERALTNPHDQQGIPEQEYDQTIGFITHAIALIEQQSASGSD